MSKNKRNIVCISLLGCGPVCHWPTLRYHVEFFISDIRTAYHSKWCLLMLSKFYMSVLLCRYLNSFSVQRHLNRDTWSMNHTLQLPTQIKQDVETVRQMVHCSVKNTVLFFLSVSSTSISCFAFGTGCSG